MSGKVSLLLLIFLTCFVTGCGSKIELPDNPKVYEQRQNDEEGYAYLIYEDKIFVPYCPYESKYLGECIGYCDLSDPESAETDRIYICELKGYSSDEWIIDLLDINCSEGMILREINAEDIPDGLDSEYEWNSSSVLENI